MRQRGGGGKNIQYGHEQTNSPIVCSNFYFFSDPTMLVNKSFVLESDKAPIVVPVWWGRGGRWGGGSHSFHMMQRTDEDL